MLPPSSPDQPSPHQHNVRLIGGDDSDQPSHSKRAMELQKTMLVAAATMGIEAQDMPGLHGLCVEAIRAAEREGR